MPSDLLLCLCVGEVLRGDRIVNTPYEVTAHPHWALTVRAHPSLQLIDGEPSQCSLDNAAVSSLEYPSSL